MNASTRAVALSPALNRFGAMFAGIALVLTFAFTPAASASDRIQVSAGFHGGYDGLTSITYRNRSSRAFRNGRHHQRRFSHRTNRNFRFHCNNRNFGLHRNGRNSYYDRAPRANYTRGCHRVSKAGYWNGYRATIGGRQCIDSRGYSYIVPNSRYLIRYW